MTYNSGKKIQAFIAFLVFLLSSITVFNPIYKSGSQAVAILSSTAASAITFELSLYLFSRQWQRRAKCIPVYITLSSLSCIISCGAALIYLTEIIKDVSYITGRDVSLFYYTMLAFALLCVSLYLCFNSQKGIYRFLILTLFPIVLTLVIMAFGFYTTKTVFTKFDFSQPLSPLFKGIVMGVFLAADTGIFICIFNESLKDNDGRIFKGTLRLSFWTAMLIFGAFCLIPRLLFGKGLVNRLDDVPYSALKLFMGMDMTEVLSATRIIAFLVKSSVYIYASASLFSKCIKHKKHIKNKLILVMYSLIPATFLLFSFFDKTLEYGAFQYLIYPFVFTLGIIFSILHLLCKSTS